MTAQITGSSSQELQQDVMIILHGSQCSTECDGQHTDMPSHTDLLLHTTVDTEGKTAFIHIYQTSCTGLVT